MRGFMKYVILSLMAVIHVMLGTQFAAAVTGVNPSGVNVSHSSPSTVFLTFQGLSAGQNAVEAFWCGAVTTTAVGVVDPCVAGTVFGRLPLRNNIGRASGTAGSSNFTDIMSIPASVTRRAYQDAQQGKDSRFFYVRHFSNPTAYAVVTCRMAGGGARVPFSLVDVKMKFMSDSPVVSIPKGSVPPEVVAKVRYTGTGRLTGRWEVVSPGDEEPTIFDLLPEASLPIEKRALQKRYTVLDRFDLFLPPTGEVTVPGPDVDKIPHQADGYYKLLFRVEATVDKESNSNAVTGTVASGGAAGFPMPMLRYYVGESKNAASGKNSPELLLPDKTVEASKDINFTWVALSSASFEKLDVMVENEVVLSAVIKGGVGYYQAPPWLREHSDKELKWRITSLGSSGSELTVSHWQSFRIIHSDIPK